jgi:hypothetical protein
LIDTILNTNEFLFCDNFEHDKVSKLSLFLFEDFYTLLAKNKNNEVLSVVQEKFESLEQLEKLLTNHEIFQIACAKDVYWMPGNFMLVPTAFYEKDKEGIYGTFLEEPNLNFDFVSAPCSYETHVISSIPEKLKDFLSKFPETKILPGVSNFLNHIHQLPISTHEIIKDKIYVTTHMDFCWIAVFIEKKLHLLNKFSIQSKEDLLKYIFGVTHQLGLEQGEFKIEFIGDLHHQMINQPWIDHYFKNGEIVTPVSNLTYLGETGKIQVKGTLEMYWHTN